MKREFNVPEKIPTEVFRMYDIRGEVGPHSITADLAYAIGLAVGTEMQNHHRHELIVGRDGRLSGPELSHAFISGVLATGINVLDIGVVSSPILYFATHHLTSDSGVMVTASHNPKDHNGFKIVIAGKTLTMEAIQKLKQLILNKQFKKGNGVLSTKNITQDYIDNIVSKVHLKKSLKVVIDCANGATSEVAPKIFRALGCEVIELYCKIDGNFPNHPADPSIPENLTDLIAAVKKHQADIGFAFDGDGDRVGVITEKGEVVWPDRQLMLFAQEVLSRNPGATIVFDVKCSNLLPKIIKAAGGVPLMYRTGHSLLKNKMKEVGAPLAGEMSGHIFFKDGWFGFDDGIYVGARLLQLLSQDSRPISEIFMELPNSINTPELKLFMPEDQKALFMQRLLSESNFGSAEKITIDGLRVEFVHGWGLIRPSNTSPYLILRFEAETSKELEMIQSIFRRELLKLDSKLNLPF